MPTRPCRFCLSLQDDSVFADFDLDAAGLVFLRRISFDGHGCCEAEFRKMSSDASRVLIDAVEQGVLETPNLEGVLRHYFRENADIIWPGALTDHELL